MPPVLNARCEEACLVSGNELLNNAINEHGYVIGIGLTKFFIYYFLNRKWDAQLPYSKD